MKAEHRKELETNALAEGMGRVIRGIKKPPQGRYVYLWLGLAVIVIIGGGYWYISRNASIQSNAEGWAALDTATDMSKVFNAGFSFEEGGREPTPINTNQGKVARFQFAWYLLYEAGVRPLLANPERAFQNIKEAKRQFTQLAEECENDPVLAPEALYSIAVAEETLACDNPLGMALEKQLGAALQAYKKVVKNHENSAFGKLAAKRIAELESKEERTKIDTFYTRFSDEVFLVRFRNQQQQMPPAIPPPAKAKK